MQADYEVIKNGFMIKARTLTDHFTYDWQVTDNDADANRGALQFLITQPGAAPITLTPGLATKKIYDVSWNIVFDIQIKYKDYKTSWNKFSALRDAILNLYVFTLDKTLPTDKTFTAFVPGIWDIMITAPEPPGQKPPGGTPTWIGQRLIAVILQRIDITR